ncbi:hypothetical protein B0H63DRAFT_395770 [Podospora didyma]|uniref:DNA polymerase n=1 Tax=Podospora didyma TaxID=330526 RepID=A0AAE0NIC7_9PEZI|nr:hypothetical protein B0H63DRAFT_395770 [Podospora didyma]
MDVFRVRLNCIDHYQATPTPYDPRLRNDILASQAVKEPRVPVVRVFGSTETGQKVCAHIHGAFPYLYVEYRSSLVRREVNEFIYRLHLSIDRALAVSYRNNDAKPNAQPRFVARITLVKGVPFYGFNVGYRYYLKIYMLNPVTMTRLADLLQQGLVMGQRFQPYEAHLQYLLQFMIDFNLYGCTYIEARKLTFRAPVPDPLNGDDCPRMWDSSTIPPELITEHFGLPRVSHCQLEVDMCVQDILNRTAVKERRLHHDFIELQYPMPPGIKLVPSMASLWKDETNRRKKRMAIADTGSSPFPAEVLVPMSVDPRHSQPPGWIHEEEYREQMQELIGEESKVDGADFSFSTYVKPDPLGDSVKTVFQSVEDLFPENLLRALGLEESFTHPDVASSVEVDEQGILALDVDEGSKQLLPDDLEGVPIQAVQHAGESAGPVINQNGPDKPPQAANGGSSEQQPRPAAENDLNLTINGLGDGLCVSGLRSGRRPNMPFPSALSEVAMSRELVSKLNGPNVEQPEEIASVASKRPRPDSQGGVLPKRRCLDTTHNTDKTAAKPSGNHPLNFSVVKDPQDPNTGLRLSQQSGSQRSEDDLAKKQVSFDPLLSMQETSSKNLSSKASALSSSSDSGSTNVAMPFPKLPWGVSDRMFVLKTKPPSAAEVYSTMRSNGLPDVIYQDAFYSADKDVPPRPREYAGREFRLGGSSVPYLPEFDALGHSPATFGIKPDSAPNHTRLEADYEKRQKGVTTRNWEIAIPPPTPDEVSKWWDDKQARIRARQTGSTEPAASTQSDKPYLSQITGATPKNKHGFKYSQKQQSTSVEHEAQYMSTMSVEVHVNTRGRLVPNPEEDEVQCIFWRIRSDENSLRSSQSPDMTQAGIIVLSDEANVLGKRVQREASVEVVQEYSELDVLIRMVEIVRAHDPDILTGYEVHGSSWGYLIERARFQYDYDLCDELSRMKSQSHGRAGKEADRWGFNTTSTIRVTGRHVVNVWRAMRGELNLLQYTMENVAWHLLHIRIPHHSWQTLTSWYQSKRPRDLSKVLRYYEARTRLDIEILETNELIPRTSEQARLLGVDFFSVFSRGSQFKVESIMFRIAKPENFVLVSPSRKQVGGQNALECLPLVMEPQSAFYSSPVLVLDFQSLYPSVMIAYNYCYSTFLGRIVNWRGTNKMGFAEYRRREGLLGLLREHINIAPNGVMYTKPEIRKSLLAKMLGEILETRVMVKSGMKQDRDDKTLQRLLNNRQLALKLLANVTYGYTSASFSGRMPCSEIADSIVQTGRETLERAIAFIHSVARWGAEVVYGDTDSLFIHLEGRTRQQAFDIGAEIAKAITDMNPRPIKLKFEKVYHPCVLLAKKRYVGYKFETPDQAEPEFDAKGIETVRRDGTPAQQKMEEKALKILFDTADLSQVKAYFQEQCTKIMRGDVSVQDFCFAREVKLGTYSAKGPGPAGALISTKRMLEDPRAEPQYGERVPYVIISSGAPGSTTLAARSVPPEELLNSVHASLDSQYYITRNIIPPLERIFNLVGANVRAWYDEMTKVQPLRSAATTRGLDRGRGRGWGLGLGQRHKNNKQQTNANTNTLEFFLTAASCLVCHVKIKTATRAAAGRHHFPICWACAKAHTAVSLGKLQVQLNKEQRKLDDVVKVCQACVGFAPVDDVHCDSGDCPVYYTRLKQFYRFRATQSKYEPLIEWLAQQKMGQLETGRLDW